ncbi:MAG: hypothetical protein IMZ46_13135 [Acidobacteria bacterium]|nr:hypothetical protein [Acidobacteriota bacterium]
MKTPVIKRRRERKGRPEALAELIAGGTRGSAAKAAGVSGRTLDRWLAEPGFKAELGAARARTFNDALTLLKGQAGRAVKTLAALLNSKWEDERRQAAVKLLDFAMRAHDAGEFEARLVAIEKMLEENSHRPGGRQGLEWAARLS